MGDCTFFKKNFLDSFFCLQETPLSGLVKAYVQDDICNVPHEMEKYVQQ